MVDWTVFLQRRVQLGSLCKVSQSAVADLVQHVKIPNLGLLLVSVDPDPSLDHQVFSIDRDWLLGVGVCDFYATR